MLKSNLICKNLSYSVIKKKLFRNISLSLGNEKTGLVGSNGVGKTTLLRLIVQELIPQSGEVCVSGNVGYLPQNFVVNQDQTISEVFGIDQKIESLKKINDGLGSQHDFEIVGDDWDVVERTKKILHECKLDELDLSRQIKTLSGGQVTRVFFARLMVNKADFLILDEPTNNLDSESRLALYEMIKSFDGGILVVSHDRKLLELMDQIIEMSPLGIKTYGGNYTDFIEQKRIEQEALEQDFVDAKKHLKKTKRNVQLSKERYEQRVQMGNKSRRSGGQPKMFLDYHKQRAEKTKSKLEGRTDKQLEMASDKLDTVKSKFEQKELLDFKLEATMVHNTKLVLEIQNLIFAYPGCDQVIFDFNMTLVGPRRVAISGNNGSGKTTLLKLIMGQLSPTGGTMKIGVEHCAYLDQDLSVLNRHQTILENFQRLNPNVKDADCRLRLAAFLFVRDDVFKLVGDLSGGEKMRAALACVLMGDLPPQLVLLDEPTNNMDFESIASVESALRVYKGALLVVSHDTTFLKNIGVEEEIELKMGEK